MITNIADTDIHIFQFISVRIIYNHNLNTISKQINNLIPMVLKRKNSSTTLILYLDNIIHHWRKGASISYIQDILQINNDPDLSNDLSITIMKWILSSQKLTLLYVNFILMHKNYTIYSICQIYLNETYKRKLLSEFVFRKDRYFRIDSYKNKNALFYISAKINSDPHPKWFIRYISKMISSSKYKNARLLYELIFPK